VVNSQLHEVVKSSTWWLVVVVVVEEVGRVVQVVRVVF
jgi:hypothetical protein